LYHLGDPFIFGNEACVFYSSSVLKYYFDGVSKEGSLSYVDGWEGLVKYNIGPRKVGVGGIDGGSEGGLGLNCGKRFGI
jgi:hypothetical protein